MRTLDRLDLWPNGSESADAVFGLGDDPTTLCARFAAAIAPGSTGVGGFTTAERDQLRSGACGPESAQAALNVWGPMAGPPLPPPDGYAAAWYTYLLYYASDPMIAAMLKNPFYQPGVTTRRESTALYFRYWAALAEGLLNPFGPTSRAEAPTTYDLWDRTTGKLQADAVAVIDAAGIAPGAVSPTPYSPVGPVQPMPPIYEEPVPLPPVNGTGGGGGTTEPPVYPPVYTVGGGSGDTMTILGQTVPKSLVIGAAAVLVLVVMSSKGK